MTNDNGRLRECLDTVQSLVHNLPRSGTADQIDKLITETLGATVPASTGELAEFRNALRIMLSIDWHELAEAGLRLPGREWVAFRANPFRWLIRAGDEDAEKLWAIIERRQARRAAPIHEGQTDALPP